MIVVNPWVFDGLGPIGRHVVVSHEATHVATGATTVSMPLWVAEGFADYVGVGSVDVPLRVSARAAVRQIRKSGLPDRLPRDSAFHAGGGAEATYEEAWLAMRLIARQYGQDAPGRLLRGRGAPSQCRRCRSTGQPRDHAGRPDEAMAFHPSGACRWSIASVIDMTRTLVVTNDFPPRRGGIENFVFALCEAMPPDQVVVYTARMAGSDLTDGATPFPVVRDRARMLLPTRRVAHATAALARDQACDRVVFGAAAPLGLLARGLRRRAGISHVTVITHGHEVWWARVPGARQALRRIGDDADVVTYVSRFCRDRIAPALSPAARGRMQQLSPTVDTARFHPAVDGSPWRRRLGLHRMPRSCCPPPGWYAARARTP